MAPGKKQTHTLHDRRKGESALSEFADYVQGQQQLRYPTKAATSAVIEDHDELDILNDLDLADKSPAVRLKDLLLDNGEDTLGKLANILELRIDEGHGETIFDLGTENNGDSMGLTKEEWDVAMKRLKLAAKQARADCQILFSKGEEDTGDFVVVGGGHTGKILIRQQPASVEDVMETRIAVVGNVDAGKSTMLGMQFLFITPIQARFTGLLIY
jgi:hypothetical protein